MVKLNWDDLNDLGKAYNIILEKEAADRDFLFMGLQVLVREHVPEYSIADEKLDFERMKDEVTAAFNQLNLKAAQDIVAFTISMLKAQKEWMVF